MERIVVNTHDMFKNCMSVIESCLWDDPKMQINLYLNAARDLSDGNMNNIRQLFKDGDATAVMLGEMMKELGDDTEIEVIHDIGDEDKKIGVLVPFEISF